MRNAGNESWTTWTGNSLREHLWLQYHLALVQIHGNRHCMVNNPASIYHYSWSASELTAC